MQRSLVLIGILLIAGALLCSGPAAAQGLCGRAHCVALPDVFAPMPAHQTGSRLIYIAVGVAPRPLLYGLFANDAGTPLCDVEVAYAIDNPSIDDMAGTARIAVLMPDEIEWRGLSNQVESGYSLTTEVRSWRASDCSYIRLTPAEQQVTAIDLANLQVTGSVRNDTGQTLSDLRVRLMPGNAFSHHHDLQLTGISLSPGATAIYSETLQLWYHGGTITSFSVSAIGRGD